MFDGLIMIFWILPLVFLYSSMHFYFLMFAIFFGIFLSLWCACVSLWYLLQHPIIYEKRYYSASLIYFEIKLGIVWIYGILLNRGTIIIAKLSFVKQKYICVMLLSCQSKQRLDTAWCHRCSSLLYLLCSQLLQRTQSSQNLPLRACLWHQRIVLGNTAVKPCGHYTLKAEWDSGQPPISMPKTELIGTHPVQQWGQLHSILSVCNMHGASFSPP